ncbi:hypothetical protein [Halopelagius longus]|nr:hypothetical protein [Halopelagius longus]
MTESTSPPPRCQECGAELTRKSTGTLALSATTLCPMCDRSA